MAAVPKYVSSAASWHIVVAPIRKVVTPVDGLTVTILLALVVPHSPVAVAVIVAAPLKAASQFITPLNAFITPAPAGSTEYDIDVLFNAVAVYVSSAAFWHTVTAPAVKTVAPVDGFIVTTLLELVVPQSPVAVAVIVAAPLKAAFQFITPVPALITPAPAGSTEYAIEVLLAAVAKYVSSVASWHIVVAPIIKIVAPVDGLTVTILLALVVPHSPVAVAVIVAAPLKAASQFITPLNAFITPAPAGNAEYAIDVLLAAEAV